MKSKVFFLLLLICSFSGLSVKAQKSFVGEKNDPPFVYDETPVHVFVEGYKNFYVYVLYSNKDLLYMKWWQRVMLLLLPAELLMYRNIRLI